VITELMQRQRVLTVYALVMLALMVPTLVLLRVDLRTIRDVSVWASRIHPSASRSDTSRSGTAGDHLVVVYSNLACAEQARAF
jgi:hypothetical protein